MGSCTKSDGFKVYFEQGKNANQEDKKILRLPCYRNKEASSNHRPGDEQEDKEVDVHLKADYLSKDILDLVSKQSLCCVFSFKWYLTDLKILTPTVRMKRTVRRVKGTMIFPITVATFAHFHLYKIDSF